MTHVRLAIVASVVTTAFGFGAAPARAQMPAGATVVVLPFENPLGNPRAQWLREAVAELLTADLDGEGTEVVDRAERMAAFERLQIPALATLSRASVIKVGQALGATVIVTGAVELAADEVSVRARTILLDTGRMLPEVSQRGPLTDLFAVAERLAASLGAPEAARTATARASLPATLSAFELYVKALLADSPSAQRDLLERALQASPLSERVRLGLWTLHTDEGNYARAYEVASSAPAEAATDAVKFAAAISLVASKRLDEAFAELRALQPSTRAAAVPNAIGVVQLRRGETPQTGRPTYFFSQANEQDPADADYCFNLGYAYWQEHDAKATIYWLKEAVRRDPGDGDAHFVLGVALQQTGAAAEAARERELARRLASKYATWEARSSVGGDPVPKGLERLHDRLDRPSSRVDAIITTSGQRDQEALATFHLDAGRRAFARDADREATQELRRALFLSPYLAEAHLLLGRIYLRSGRADEAVEAFKIALWSEETADAHVALGEAYLELKDATSARAEVERALALDPMHAAALTLRQRLP